MLTVSIYIYMTCLRLSSDFRKSLGVAYKCSRVTESRKHNIIWVWASKAVLIVRQEEKEWLK